jgi:hypothetical protein
LGLQAFNTAISIGTPVRRGTVAAILLSARQSAALEPALRTRGFTSTVHSPDRQRVRLGELARIRASGQGSFLAVLKTFGHQASPGMLSFPQAGANLALDFPNGGDATLRLFARLDAIVAAAGGRLYPAKDARMPGTLFRQGYPQWQAFAKFVDPRFSSSFWRRVTEN